MKRNAWRLPLPVLAAVVSLGLASSSKAAELQIHLSGMIALHPASDGSLAVLLVNEFDELLDSKMPVVHAPLLEIPCDRLVGASPAESQRLIDECKMWPKTYKGANRVLALDRGIDIVIRVGGADPSGNVGLPANYSDLVVPADKLLGGFAGLGKLRSEAFGTSRKYVASQTVLRGGSLLLTKGESGAWDFYPPADPKSKLSRSALASAAQWALPIGTKDVEFQLVDRVTGSTHRTLKLKPSGNFLSVGITNEPDPMDFCLHAPTRTGEPFDHFRAFHELSLYSKNNVGSDLKDAPQAFPSDPSLLCPTAAHSMSSTKFKGRRVNCMMVSYPARE